mgnify:CR=1 FL=1
MNIKTTLKKNLSRIFKLAFIPLIISFDQTNLADQIQKNDTKSYVSKEYLFKKDYLNDYIIGEGDILLISFESFLPYSKKLYEVDQDGKIDFPNLGKIYIKGLSISELEDLLTEINLDYVKFQDLKVSIATHRPIRIIIEGEINTPGFYTLKGEYLVSNQSIKISSGQKGILSNNEQILSNSKINENLELSLAETKKINSPSTRFYPTLFDALQKAEGVTLYSDLSNIQVVRKNTISNGGGKIAAKIDFLSFISGKDMDQNIRLFDGDVIKISKSSNESINQLSKAIKSNLNPKFMNIIVSGEVQIPGVKSIAKNASLNDAILMAGNLNAFKGPIYLIRYKTNGDVETRKIKFKLNNKRGSKNNPILKDGDILNVNKSGLKSFNEIIRDVTFPFVPIYSTYKLFD